jgi:probable phosphoglycerate mutase
VSSVTTVIVVRHGQSEGNVSRQLSSAAPGSPLTDAGRAQAAQVGRALASSPDHPVPTHVYSSPLLRTRQTAALIAEQLGVADVALVPGVREFELGRCEGSADDDDWALVDAVFDSWLDGDLERSVPEAETGRRLVERAHAALDGVADDHPGGTVVVVSHGGVMSITLPRLASNVPDDRARGSGVPNCGVVRLRRDDTGWQLLSWPSRAPQLGGSEHPGDLTRLVDVAEAERNAPPAHPGVGAEYEQVGGVWCARLPIDQPWATQASLAGQDGPVPPSRLFAVRDWLEQRSPHAWHLVVGEREAPRVAVHAGLVEVGRHGAWVCETAPTTTVPHGVEIDVPRDLEEFLGVYGEQLRPVVEPYLDDPDRELVVLRVDGVTVACARLVDLAGTTYVGGVTVLPHRRGEGWGLAVSAAATRRALQRSPIAWLHCEDDVSGLYARLGYARVTTHVHLAPPARTSTAAPDAPAG